jgi:TPR repeat protein
MSVFYGVALDPRPYLIVLLGSLAQWILTRPGARAERWVANVVAALDASAVYMLTPLLSLDLLGMRAMAGGYSAEMIALKRDATVLGLVATGAAYLLAIVVLRILGTRNVNRITLAGIGIGLALSLPLGRPRWFAGPSNRAYTYLKEQRLSGMEETRVTLELRELLAGGIPVADEGVAMRAALGDYVDVRIDHFLAWPSLAPRKREALVKIRAWERNRKPPEVGDIQAAFEAVEAEPFDEYARLDVLEIALLHGIVTARFWTSISAVYQRGGGASRIASGLALLARELGHAPSKEWLELTVGADPSIARKFRSVFARHLARSATPFPWSVGNGRAPTERWRHAAPERWAGAGPEETERSCNAALREGKLGEECAHLGEYHARHNEPVLAAQLFDRHCAVAALLPSTPLSGYGCLRLGTLLERGAVGRGSSDPADGEVAVNASGARVLYFEACIQGAGDGCAHLAAMLLHGHGGAENPALAVAVLRDGCEEGNPIACRKLGEAFAQGVGVERDSTRALSKLQLACDREDATACANLGQHQAASSPDSAAMSFAEAIDGHPAPEDYGFTVDYGKLVQLGVDSRSKRSASDIFAVGCHRGVEPACDLLVNALGARDAAARKVSWLPFRNARTWRALAYLYDDSEHIEAYNEQGCRGGDALACHRLDQRYRLGLAQPTEDTLRAPVRACQLRWGLDPQLTTR